MKLTNSRKYVVEFRDIAPGQCFEHNGNYFMKIEGATIEAENAVNLRNGAINMFGPEDKVEPYTNAEVVLR